MTIPVCLLSICPTVSEFHSKHSDATLGWFREPDQAPASPGFHFTYRGLPRCPTLPISSSMVIIQDLTFHFRPVCWPGERSDSSLLAEDWTRTNCRPAPLSRSAFPSDIRDLDLLFSLPNDFTLSADQHKSPNCPAAWLGMCDDFQKLQDAGIGPMNARRSSPAFVLPSIFASFFRYFHLFVLEQLISNFVCDSTPHPVFGLGDSRSLLPHSFAVSRLCHIASIRPFTYSDHTHRLESILVFRPEWPVRLSTTAVAPLISWISFSSSDPDDQLDQFLFFCLSACLLVLSRDGRYSRNDDTRRAASQFTSPTRELPFRTPSADGFPTRAVTLTCTRIRFQRASARTPSAETTYSDKRDDADMHANQF